MSDRVQIEIDDGVADVRLDRPDKMNALDTAMFVAIAEAGERVANDPSVRAVVLSGEGRAFCSGLDFSSFQAMAGASNDDADSDAAGGSGAVFDTSDRITHLGQQVAHVWQEVPVPVIAAVHGVALGGGCQIALGADLRICTPDARFSVLEIKWGLIPDMTGTWMLPRLVGLDVAKELTFTGRMVEGTEAVQLGLATRVSDDPKAAALALAREIAGKSPEAVRAAKRLLNDSGSVPIAEQFAAERAEIAALIGSPNQVEAVMAGFEKREPRFR
ncbi:crotonase/enoyl-CoA hydratase family protein [Actinospongicola halichondriae]|uniref:crotonase/enoyl-CoA hydratase family protein n=1 Tax=Actinospongicola halichondriae TaxID=3236844 RepID=UPI003D38FFA9